MQFFILFIGAMVFVFFLFEQPPILFQRAELDRVEHAREFRPLAERYGSQAVLVAIDAKRVGTSGRFAVYARSGQAAADREAVEWAREAEDVLWRRTKCGLHMSEEEQRGVRDWLAARV